MTRPANRDYGSRQRVRIVNGDSENYPASDTHGPYHTQVTAYGTNEVVAAPGTGFYLCITSLWLSNNNALPIRVLVRDGSGGNVGFGGTLAADGGGVAMRFTPPWQLSEDTELSVELTDESGGAVDVNVNFYTE